MFFALTFKDIFDIPVKSTLMSFSIPLISELSMLTDLGIHCSHICAGIILQDCLIDGDRVG